MQNIEARNQSVDIFDLFGLGRKFPMYRYPWLLRLFLGNSLELHYSGVYCTQSHDFRTMIQGTPFPYFFMFMLICGLSLRPAVRGINSTGRVFLAATNQTRRFEDKISTILRFAIFFVDPRFRGLHLHFMVYAGLNQSLRW